MRSRHLIGLWRRYVSWLIRFERTFLDFIISLNFLSLYLIWTLEIYILLLKGCFIPPDLDEIRYLLVGSNTKPASPSQCNSIVIGQSDDSSSWIFRRSPRLLLWKKISPPVLLLETKAPPPVLLLETEAPPPVLPDRRLFRLLGIMGKTFSQRCKVLVSDTSWRSDDSTSFWQLGQDFAHRVAQLVMYCLLVTSMNMADLESFKNQHHIKYFLPCLHYTIDWRCNRLLASTLLSFKRCVLVNQL